MESRDRLSMLFVLLALLIVVALVIVAAGPPGVRRVPVREDSEIGRFLPGCTYSDCYRTEVPAGVAGPAFLRAIAFQKGELIVDHDDEIVYRGTAPGLEFHVSYAARPGATGRIVVEIATVVHASDRTGRVYFFFVKPVHRAGLPWLTRKVVRDALRRHDRS